MTPITPDTYDIDETTPDREQTLGAYAAASAAVPTADARLDIAYGDDPAERLDVHFPAGTPRGTVLFLHGGYWRGGAKEQRRFLAPGITAAGFVFVNVEYPLTPRVPLAAIVASARKAVAWTADALPELGAADAPLVVTGNSAGAHLAVLAAGHPRVDAAVALSGLYDLRPLVGRPQGQGVTPDEATAAALSPALLATPVETPFFLAVGGEEPDSFIGQTMDFFRHRRALGARDGLLVAPGFNHFTIIAELAATDSPIFRAVAAARRR